MLREIAAFIGFIWPQCRGWLHEVDLNTTTYCYLDRWHRGPHESFSGWQRWR